MSRHPRALPAELGTAFTPAQARAEGVTARRLRARDLERPFRGLSVVRPTGQEEEPEDTSPSARAQAQRAEVLRLARLYQPLMVQHAFFIGRTAAVLHRLPVDPAEHLEVGVCAPHRAPRRQGITGRQIAPQLVAVREIEGLRVTGPVSTWATLATKLSVRELIAVGDAIVRVPRDSWGRRRPEQALSTIDQLHAVVASGRRPGLRELREALPLIRVGSASPLETDYRVDAEAAGLPAAELDVEIRDGVGRLLGISEFFYREFGLVVEVEGDHHRTSREQWNRDIEKYAAYTAIGVETVRLTSAHIRGANPRAAGMVRAALIRRGWRP
jgi:hypothetical protein